MDNTFGSSMQSKSDADGGFADIPPNRTLMAGQFTSGRPDKPEVVQGLQTLTQVFNHYKPEVSIDFRDREGQLVVETLQFRQLDDFGLDAITTRSSQLQRNAALGDEYLHIINQLRNNKKLQAALEDPQAKGALLDSIHGMIAALKTNP